MTSTSDAFDFARALADGFVERRGRGSALSAADRHLADQWEADGAPLDVVLAGIDAAFERRRDAPRSLKDCKRWVNAAIKRWREEGMSPAPAADDDVRCGSAPSHPERLQPAERARPSSGRTGGDVTSSVAPAAPDAHAMRVLEAVRSARAAASHPDVQTGLGIVEAEVETMIEQGTLDAQAVAALDDVAAVAAHRASGAADPHAPWAAQVRSARAALGRHAPRLVDRVLAGTTPRG